VAIDKNFKVKHGLEVADSAIINGILVAAGLKYPTVDGNVNDVIKTDGSGNLSLGKLSISDLDDVVLASLREGGLLVYDSAAQKWTATNSITVDKQDITTDGGFY
jgi:hypothetical protein